MKSSPERKGYRTLNGDLTLELSGESATEMAWTVTPAKAARDVEDALHKADLQELNTLSVEADKASVGKTR